MLADIVKIATFSSFFIHLAFCQNFAPDSDTNIIPGGTVKLVCNITVAAFIATVTLSKDNVQKSFCDNANICTPYSSDSGRYQYSSNSSVVTVQISNLTKASDEGTWTCQVGSSSPVTYIFVFPSATEPDNEEQIDSACTGAFECGFCPILIVVVSSVIICILMWKEVPKRIGGFSTVKIVIIVIFSVVAIGIGLGLGLGLREGEENCLNCEATIGISISLGVALSVMQFAIIFNCNNEKECKDSKGFSLDNCFRKCRVKPDVDKKSPASASEVKVEAE